MAALTTAVVQLVLVRYYSSQVAGVEGFLVTQSSMTSVLALRQYMPSYGKASQQRKATTLWLAKSGTKKKKAPDRTVAVNRIAYRNYEIIDTMEAGISLLGTEVKSIRDGKLNLRDGYVRPSKNGRSCVLYNVHVGKCSQVGAEYFQHEEKRPRTLLVHSSQARKFLQQTEQQGMTVIPLKAYWNDGNKLKIEIALCRGKNVRDKRATIQERDAKRETSRIIKNFRI
jgi:SsrA-binding protein